MKELFLDANAHVPINNEAIKKFIEFNASSGGHGHPLSPSAIGRNAAMQLEEARVQIAELIGAEHPSNIVITSTCTQACEWAVKILKHADNDHEHAFVSPAEHSAITQSFEDTFDEYKELSLNKNGVIIDQKLPNNSKACCIHVQNEIGVIQPLDKLKCKFLLSDLSQTIGKVPFKISDTNIDIGVFAGHKFGGFMVGFIYLRDTNYWKPLGCGSRYFLDRAGTPDVAGVIGTAAALKDSIDTLEERTQKMLDFRDTLEIGLKDIGFEIIGEGESRVPNTTFAKAPTRGLAMQLLLKLAGRNIHIGLGSACGSLYTGGNPLMQKLGRPSNGEDYMRVSTFGQYDSSDASFFLDQLVSAAA